MKILSTVLLFALLASASALAQDNQRITFRGNYIGMTRSRWNANPENGSNAYLDVSSPDAWRHRKVHIVGSWCSDSPFGLTDLVPLVDGDIVCTVVIPGRYEQTLVGKTLVSSLTYEFRAEKLSSISFQYPSVSYQAVLEAFREKYGTPDIDSHEQYQNAFGAVWSGGVEMWTKGRAFISVTEGKGNGPGQDGFDSGHDGVTTIVDMQAEVPTKHQPSNF